MNPDNYLGKLIGNTGQPDKLTVALRDSYSARRGEFIRLTHQERRSEPATGVLGRIVAGHRLLLLGAHKAQEIDAVANSHNCITKLVTANENYSTANGKLLHCKRKADLLQAEIKSYSRS